MIAGHITSQVRAFVERREQELEGGCQPILGAAVVIGGSGHVLGCTPGGAEGVLLEGPRGALRASGGREAMGKTKVCFPTKVLTRSDAVLRLARHFVRRISISHACRYRQDHPRPNARTKLAGQNES